MTTMNIRTPATRRLLTLAALGVGSIAWGQDAPSAPEAAPNTPAPASAPTAVNPPAPTDRILPLADPNTPLGTTLGGILSGNSTAVGAIQRQEIIQREKLLAEIAERVKTADNRTTEIQQKTTGLNPDVQKDVQRAVAEYGKTKERLQQSWEAARAAEANTWERARSNLASNYAFFVAAAADVELVTPDS